MGLAPDEYAALTKVLFRLLPFKSAVGETPLRGAVEPPKKPQTEPLRAVVAPAYVPATAPLPAAVVVPTLPVMSPVLSAVADPVEMVTPAWLASPLGDHWAELVQGLIAAELIAALVRELALQSELQSQVDGIWTLRVERQSLNNAAACDKLLQAIQSLLALPDAAASPALSRLMVEVGTVTDTPARRNTAAQKERQRQAEEVIENDPFVQDMVRQWGARVVPGSIRPLAPTSASASAKPI